MRDLPALPNVDINPEDDEYVQDFRPVLEETESIIRACVLSPRVVAAARTRIDEMDLFRKGHHWFAEVWEVVRDYMQETGHLPTDVDSIMARLKQRRKQGEHCDYLSPDVKARVTRWMSNRSEIDYFAETDVLLRIDDIWHEYMKHTIHDIGELAVQDTYSREELIQELAVVREKMASRTAVHCEAKNPWREMEDKGVSANVLIPHIMRVPTGVPPLDDLTGGGPLPGEIISAVMPSKVGKTTLALQLAHNACLQGERVIYHSSEQCLEGDIALRMFVHVYGKPRSFWADHPAQDTIDIIMNSLAEKASQGGKGAAEELRLIEKRKKAWKQYLDFHDEWRYPDKIKFRSVTDLFDPIFRLKEERNENYRFMIIDWWRLFKDQYCDTGKSDNQHVLKARQSELLSSIKGYTEEAVRKGIPLTTVIFNQLSGAASEHSNGPRNQSSHSAQGDKDFNNLFDFVTASGGRFNIKQDPAIPRVKFNHETGRSAAGGSKIYRLDGNNGVFLSEDPEIALKWEEDEKEKEEKAARSKSKKDRSGGGRRSGQI